MLTLLDTGTRRDPERIVRAIRKVGRSPSDVRQIVVTHSHGDHAGGASRMRELCEAPVVAGAADAETIAGRAPYPFQPAAWARAIYGRLSNFPRFEVDRRIQERTEVDGGLVVVPAPGHTPGHIAVLAPDLEALFVADALWNLTDLRPSWKGFTQDRPRAVETVRELADLPAQSLHFGHGRSIRRDGRRRLLDVARAGERRDDPPGFTPP